jgi:hypothetical protein
MIIHSTIRTGLRILVASLVASFAFAVWPLSADAKGNNGSHVSTHEITITKKVDKSSPTMSSKKGVSNSGPSESIHFNYGGTKPVYTPQ